MKKYLLDKLTEYSQSDTYPFHMPGHKRRMEFPDPFSIDITEIDGFDDLHHPNGILKESMEWAADIYGADRTYYLVNGSSSGILSAICSTTRPGGGILIGRNCHKSVYHGVFLNNLDIVYTYPQIVANCGLFCGILPEDIRKLLINNPNIEAVLIVSPTYDGVVSDIGRIAEIVHEYGIPLIVDEAHGAHLPFGDGPVSALKCGADIVIQSVHKTLPSLTQTAVMHVKSNRVDIARLERYLQIYQSSSPSYVFLSSIEKSIGFMNTKGREQLAVLHRNLEDFRQSLSGLNCISLAGPELIGDYGIYDYDITKLWIGLKACVRVFPDGHRQWMSGEVLGDILRHEYQLEPEGCGLNYVLALCSCMDSREGIERLAKALIEIDRQLEPAAATVSVPVMAEGGITPEPVLTISAAWGCQEEMVDRKECWGRVSAAFIYIYPPGIPIVVPGERLTDAVLAQIEQYCDAGLVVHGISEVVACVAEEIG